MADDRSFPLSASKGRGLPPAPATACATLFAASCTITIARGEEPGALTGAEATLLATGKKITYPRVRDGATIARDFRSDGTIYYRTSNTTRQAIPSGAYTIDDDGAGCLKWNPDRHNASADGCVVFRRDGDETVVAGKRSDTVTGTLIDPS